MMSHIDYRGRTAVCVEVKRRKAASWRQPDHHWKLYEPLVQTDVRDGVFQTVWLFACWAAVTTLLPKFAKRAKTWPNKMAAGTLGLHLMMKSKAQIDHRYVGTVRGWLTLREVLREPQVAPFWRCPAGQALLSAATQLGHADQVRFVFWKM